MLYTFSDRSEQYLREVKTHLNILAHRVIRVSHIDFAITDGLRTEERQKQLYEEGKSKTLDSKHCRGEAIDIVPYINGKADFSAINECCLIVGIFIAWAKESDISIRTGLLWDHSCLKDNDFIDAWHIELR